MSDPVVDTQFTTGTVITADWLNGVNDFVNTDGATKTYVDAVRTDLANTSDVAKGDALVGMKQVLTGATARTVHAKLTEQISVKDFGAVGDGTTDDTAAIQAAINAMATQNGVLYFPGGVYKVTSTLTASYPIQWLGEGCGVTTYNGFTTKGSTILSTVTTDYVLKVNDGGGFTRGLYLEGIRFFGNATALHGILLNGVGWDGRVTNVCFDQFVGKGTRMTTAQDIVFDRVAWLFCTTAATANYAVEMATNTNYIRFTDCRIEGCSRTLSADTNTFDVILKGLHIEMGDYTGVPNIPYNKNYTTPPIVLDSSSAIMFSNCTFVPASNDTLLVNNGGTLDSQAYFVSSTSCNRIEFINNFIHSPQLGIKFWKNKTATGWGSFRGNSISGVDCRTAFLDVDQITVSGNQFNFFDDNVTTIFKGIIVNQRSVTNNEFFAPNSGAAAKLSGTIIDTTSPRGMTFLSGNKFNISKFFRISAKAFQTTNDESSVYFGLGGGNQTVDLEKVFSGQWLFFTVGAAILTSITNGKSGQMVTFFNQSGANCTINFTAGQIVPLNSVNAVVPQNGIITFGTQDDGILYEISRSF